MIVAWAIGAILVLAVVPQLLMQAEQGAVKTAGTEPMSLALAPQPPTNLTASFTCPGPAGGWDAHLRWSPSSTPATSGYQLLWATGPNGPWQSGLTDGVTFAQSRVAAGSTRWYQVRAMTSTTLVIGVLSPALVTSATAPRLAC